MDGTIIAKDLIAMTLKHRHMFATPTFLQCRGVVTRGPYDFRLLILPFFNLKMRISKNHFIFLFPHLPTTHKPKTVMIHQEMRPVVQKNEKLTEGGNCS